MENRPTSQIHRDFVGAPMGQRPVTALPGIGPILGGRLAGHGFDKANMVFGQFLVLQQNEENFINWLNITAMANYGQAQAGYYGLREWYAQHW